MTAQRSRARARSLGAGLPDEIGELLHLPRGTSFLFRTSAELKAGFPAFTILACARVKGRQGDWRKIPPMRGSSRVR